MSYGSELRTQELLYEASRLGKAVYVPKVLADHRMDFFRIYSLEELVRDGRVPMNGSASVVVGMGNALHRIWHLNN